MPKSREAASFGRVSHDEHLTRAAGKTAGDVDADDLYLMANLPPRLTGLPMVVWLLERGRARHDARIKVSRTHGIRIDPTNTVSVAVRPAPRLPAPRLATGDLSRADLRVVAEWVELNRDVILDYWHGRIFTDELLQRIKSISG